MLTKYLSGVWRDTATAALIIVIAFTVFLLDHGDVYLRIFAAQIGGAEMPPEALRLALVGAHALFIATILPVIAALSAVIRGAVIAATAIRRTIRVRRGLPPDPVAPAPVAAHWREAANDAALTVMFGGILVVGLAQALTSRLAMPWDSALELAVLLAVLTAAGGRATFRHVRAARSFKESTPCK
ncbi:hypothetical protein GBZ48_18390 [Azospirillum melinis]|uniref:Uncharacterized protein n=1 Tax=Azospirillum melinis TaxID=328839 RepID=A0ABX2KN51_9PROT|nr:hypothetical protein [Azospirillum melinis]MBP2309720.1 hypothetical protein [Azospirillum melinis]NUB01239.1 hypothetical protein [Azospirillum melinis]